MHVILKLSDIPGMVYVISDQTESKMGGCIVHYSWSLPMNIDKANISHFTVIFNGTSKRVPNTGGSAYMMEQSVRICASHNITIIAVDKCGRNGQPRNHVVTKVSVAICQDSTMNDNDGKGSSIDCIYDLYDVPILYSK